MTLVKRIHIELSTRCQASCPMCPRNHSGGITRSFVGPTDISFEQFKKWFTDNWLSQLEYFLACGNYGDPVMNKDSLPILEYLRSHNQTCKISFHTNGSARDKDWWQRLAEIIGKQGQAVLAIDGFHDTHSLYRIGTNWDHVMNTADILIACGIDVWAETLIFDHNKHEIDQLKEFLYNRGFRHINVKYTQRFAGGSEFPVANGSILKSAENKPWQSVITGDTYENWLTNTEIDPKCQQNGGEIYVDVAGRLWPCCWVADSYTRLTDPDHGDHNWSKWSRIQGQEIKKIVEQSIPLYLRDNNIEITLENYAKQLDIWKDLWLSDRKPCECVIHCKKKYINRV